MVGFFGEILCLPAILAVKIAFFSRPRRSKEKPLRKLADRVLLMQFAQSFDNELAVLVVARHHVRTLGIKVSDIVVALRAH